MIADSVLLGQMNNVEEFYSLIKFLRIKPYSQWEKFRLDVSQPLKSGHDDVKRKAMQMLQALCKATMIRRTKKSTFEGKPILVLPERTTVIDNPQFSHDERAFYTALESKTQLTFNKYLRRGEVGKQYSAILVLLLRLRQAAWYVNQSPEATLFSSLKHVLTDFSQPSPPPEGSRSRSGSRSGAGSDARLCQTTRTECSSPDQADWWQLRVSNLLRCHTEPGPTPPLRASLSS